MADSVKVFLVSDEMKKYCYFGDLRGNKFSHYNNPDDKDSGQFIALNLNPTKLRMVEEKDIPSDFSEFEYKEDKNFHDDRETKTAFRDFEFDCVQYEVVAEYPDGGHWVNFSIHDNSKETHPNIIGSIKWDGCSNWHFTWDNYPLHFCSQTQAIEFGKFLGELYKWAAELMPSHVKDVLC